MALGVFHFLRGVGGERIFQKIVEYFVPPQIFQKYKNSAKILKTCTHIFNRDLCFEVVFCKRLIGIQGSFFKGIYSLLVTGDRQKINLDFGQKVQSSENPNLSSKRKDNTCTIF